MFAPPGRLEMPPPTRPRETSSRTLAERLGYARDAKLLIVHADDLRFWVEREPEAGAPRQQAVPGDPTERRRDPEQ